MDVLELFQVLRCIPVTDIANQSCICCICVRRVPLIVSPNDQVPRFESFLSLPLLHHHQGFVRCRSVKDLLQSNFDASEFLSRTVR